MFFRFPVLFSFFQLINSLAIGGNLTRVASFSRNVPIGPLKTIYFSVGNVATCQTNDAGEHVGPEACTCAAVRRAIRPARGRAPWILPVLIPYTLLNYITVGFLFWMLWKIQKLTKEIEEKETENEKWSEADTSQWMSDSKQNSSPNPKTESTEAMEI
ncbi:unnamed protein product [Caenorhabditis sp. 36 PRJEB53466]|nr:unnamed protein product [Caenorhabditis sp. 36 PRJEB53466]